MKTKYISLFFSFVIAFGMMSCSSEIPNGDTSKFSDLKSPEEDMVKKDYLPLKHPCMLHTQADIDRVKSNLNEQLAPGHIYHKHPEWFVTYGNQLYFDPGLPESRKFICQVVDDIVSRYDIDAIHMDDYFYPYPIAGKEFPDQKSFARYGNGLSLSDWRRNNVNFLIQELHQTISQRKPWVRFGICPFGIYRYKKNDTNGSDTNGIQNYDD